MAINAFGFEVPDAPTAAKKPLTQKQIDAMLRQQRQAKAKSEQAARDRQRDTDKKREASRVEEKQQATEKRAEERAQKKIDDSLPKGEKFSTEDVEYLKNAEGAEREQREFNLLQSLRDRGVFIYEENGVTTWIEEKDEWDVLFSQNHKYKSDYSDDDFSQLLKDF